MMGNGNGKGAGARGRDKAPCLYVLSRVGTLSADFQAVKRGAQGKFPHSGLGHTTNLLTRRREPSAFGSVRSEKATCRRSSVTVCSLLQYGQCQRYSLTFFPQSRTNPRDPYTPPPCSNDPPYLPLQQPGQQTLIPFLRDDDLADLLRQDKLHLAALRLLVDPHRAH